MVIRTPDYRLRVFVSSTLNELAEERKAVRQAILNLRLAPIMFETGARPHPARELYLSYLSQSQIFIGIYWQSYGWIAPDAQISGLEDEYLLSSSIPRLIYIKKPAPEREAALTYLLDRIQNDNTSSYTYFSTHTQLEELVQNDLALLITERFESAPIIQESANIKRARSQTNVPIPRNPLIGRERELTLACALLHRQDIALITLTGTGGTGKSRLAIQIGLEMLDHFKDGVYMVRLEPVSDPLLVLSTIAETLGIRETPGSQPINEMLKDYLHDKQMLLVLDNFEQVVDAAPGVADLLETCPKLKCIVTSRAPLRLRFEKELPVPPLKVPSLQKITNLENLSQYAAVELFIQRAQAVKPDFTVTNANAPAVAEVCYRLDGLPLAIELAAARIKLLNPQGLLSRLEHRFELLRGGTRDLPERQRTLRSAIDWSYNLLTEKEKKLFRRLSIFIDGWTLESAKPICDIDGDLNHDLDDTLCSLIDNNLVIMLNENDDQPRFGMLSTIHEYAFERLNEADEANTVHLQHARYFLEFVTQVEPLVRSAERIRWRQNMLEEFGNIRSVLVWIYTTKQYIGIGQQIVANIGLFWQFGGLIAEGRQWCNRMITLCDESTPISVKAGLLCFSGELAWTQGDYLSAVSNLDESVALCRKQADKHLLATAMVLRGMVASTMRDLSTATSILQSSLEIIETAPDDWYKAFALSLLGEIALYEDDHERAKSFLSQSIKLARQLGDPWCMMPPLMASGQMAVIQRDLMSASSSFKEAVDLVRQACDNFALSWALNGLGHVMLMLGDHDMASKCFVEGLLIAGGIGNLGVMVISLVGAAALLVLRSRPVPGEGQPDTSEMILAAHLCGATITYMDRPGIFIWVDSKILYEGAVNLAKSLVDASLWAEAYSEGKNVPIDQAVALVIEALNE